MVDTFGKDIISAYTGGVPVVSIFTYGVQVWPSSTPPTPTGYYLKWLPSNISGSFRVDGVSYRLEDYSGLFQMSGLVSYSFYQASITYFETNTPGPMTFYAFGGCNSLSMVSVPEWTEVPNYTFQSCSNLQSIYMQKVEYIGQSAFQGCYSLTGLNLPVCSYIAAEAFDRCEYMSYVSLPVCGYIGQYAFGFTALLTSIDLPVCSYIGNNAFTQIYSSRLGLNTITLRSNSVCSITVATFNDTQIKLGTGSIYVPASLVSAYKTANYWSSFSNIIYPIQ